MSVGLGSWSASRLVPIWCFSLLLLFQVWSPPADAATFSIEDFGYPVLFQKDSSRCLQFASTAIMEHLIHKASGKRPYLNEWWAVEHGSATSSSFNEFTDQPLIWMERAREYGVMKIEQKVLFNHPGTGPWSNGGATWDEVMSIRGALLQYHAPVLVVYKHDGQDFWHAVACFGFSDEVSTYYCRDSFFGEPLTIGGRDYRNFVSISYQFLLDSAKHATVFFLPSDARGIFPRAPAQPGVSGPGTPARWAVMSTAAAIQVPPPEVRPARRSSSLFRLFGRSRPSSGTTSSNESSSSRHSSRLFGP